MNTTTTTRLLALPRHFGSQPWWPWCKRILGAAFLLGVVALLVLYARHVDWGAVRRSMHAIPTIFLLLAGTLALISHVLYSSFDLVGRSYTRHALSTTKVMLIGFTSYAFNLNLGFFIGGAGFRLRLYSQSDLKPGIITRILGISALTNWLGYLVLAGVLFAAYPLPWPADWQLDAEALPWLGFALLALVTAYLVTCSLFKDRDWTLRGHVLRLPSTPMTWLQLAISCANWMLMAGIIYFLLQQQVAYLTVLNILLLAALAGVITHVPAGLGVLEGVFIVMLSPQIPHDQLLGALLTYRAIYYLVPLVMAIAVYAGFEAKRGMVNASSTAAQ